MLFFLNYVIYKHNLCDLYLMAEKIAEKRGKDKLAQSEFFFKISVFFAKRLLLSAKCSILQPHLAAVALSAPGRRDRVLAAALEAYFEEQSALLRNLFLYCVRNWHLNLMQGKALLYLSILQTCRALPSSPCCRRTCGASWPARIILNPF